MKTARKKTDGTTGPSRTRKGRGDWQPVVIDMTHGALGLPAAGEEKEWVERVFLPVQRELGVWIRDGAFPSGLAEMPSLFPYGGVSTGKSARFDTGDTPLWFMGDVHGDFLALLLAANLAHDYDHSLPVSKGGVAKSDPTRLFFLGDLIDEGPHAAEVMAWLLATGTGRPFNGRNVSVMALTGNHDTGLAYHEEFKGFWSPVSPGDFFVNLNDHLGSSAVEAFGKAVCACFRDLPRMALLNNATLAVHGGVPDAALTASIRNADDLTSPEALNSYIWGRLEEDRPTGETALFGSGTWVGYQEFDRFIEVFGRVMGASPRLLLRGHDHKPHNYKCLGRYRNCRVLTLNNFTVNGRGPRGGARYRPVTIARANRPQSDPLDIHIFQIDLPPALIEHCRNCPSILENIP
ncbi:MAG: metallophosphoesterase [Kiritimatiellaeota bacterium]|nr:metallophosphoesterase [Kiritimatiellota bacterium]